MRLPQILGLISVGILSLFIIIGFAIQVEKYARKRWMQASARQIIAVSVVMLALFGTLLLAAIIRIGLIIGGIL